MRRSLHFLSVTILALALADACAGEQVVLDAPENACWHAGSRSWFVSNLGGGLSLARDGYGWITRYDEHGALLSSRWLEFLDAPTGMAAVGDTLFVADRGGIIAIDIPSATVMRRTALDGARFLNDVAAAPNGDLYVSDTETNRIYRLVGGERAELWLESSALQNPNGLWVDGERLIVATWGPMIDIATFASKHPGTLLTIGLTDKKIAPVGAGEPIANFDGVVAVGADFYATDWVGGRLLRITADGRIKEVLKGFSQLADLGYSPETATLALPVMSENRLILLRLDALR